MPPVESGLFCPESLLYHVAPDDEILHIIMKRFARIKITNSNTSQCQEDKWILEWGKGRSKTIQATPTGNAHPLYG